MKKEVPESGYRELLLLLLKLRRRFRVRGASMFPTLNDGDVILYNPHAYARHLPQKGEIVIALHPAHAGLKIVKRVDAVTSDGRLFLVGDNAAETTDSHDFGHVPMAEILGKVTSRLA